MRLLLRNDSSGVHQLPQDACGVLLSRPRDYALAELGAGVHTKTTPTSMPAEPELSPFSSIRMRSAHGNLLDHLVGEGVERRRNRNAKRLGSLKILALCFKFATSPPSGARQ